MAYKTVHGRRKILVSTATNGHQSVVAVDGTRVTFACRAGHQMTHDYSRGPIPKRLNTWAVARLTKYWMGGNGVNGWCQKCQNIADGIERC